MRKVNFLPFLIVMGYGCSNLLAAPAKLVDSRDKKVYKTVEILGSVWMAENLNYATKKSVCYENKEENCDSYGRLYKFSEAKTVCPKGWHLANNTDIYQLISLANIKDGPDKSGAHIKSRSGWFGTCEEFDEECRLATKNGFDSFGISVKPSGRGNSDGTFESLHNYGFFWSGTNADYPFYFAVGFSYDNANIMFSGDFLDENVNNDYLPVRCVKGAAPEENLRFEEED